jgi:hypothetical protein
MPTNRQASRPSRSISILQDVGLDTTGQRLWSALWCTLHWLSGQRMAYPCFITCSRNEFGFDGFEDGLDHCVIVAIAFAAHPQHSA